MIRVTARLIALGRSRRRRNISSRRAAWWFPSGLAIASASEGSLRSRKLRWSFISGYKGTNGKRYLRAREFNGKKLIVKLDSGSQEKYIDVNEGYLDANSPASMAKAMAVSANLVRAFMVFETFNPMQGFAP